MQAHMITIQAHVIIAQAHMIIAQAHVITYRLSHEVLTTYQCVNFCQWMCELVLMAETIYVSAGAV